MTKWRYFVDDIFKSIFLNEDAQISLKISLKFIPKVRINNIPALVQIMAWRWPGNKPLSEPMMVSLLTHICVTRPQWVHSHWTIYRFSKVYQIDKFFHQITHSKMHTTACIECNPSYVNIRWASMDDDGHVNRLEDVVQEAYNRWVH